MNWSKLLYKTQSKYCLHLKVGVGITLGTVKLVVNFNFEISSLFVTLVAPKNCPNIS